MLQRALGRRMRVALLVLMILAGCVGAPARTATVSAPASQAPLHLEGSVWLPPSQGDAREETLVGIPGLVVGARVSVAIHLGGRYVIEGPVTIADVEAQLRDATNESVADAHVTTGASDATFDAPIARAGDGWLALLSYGGSDGSQNGDHVDYAIDVR